MKSQNRLPFAVLALLLLTATVASARITTDYNHKLNFGQYNSGNNLSRNIRRCIGSFTS